MHMKQPKKYLWCNISQREQRKIYCTICPLTIQDSLHAWCALGNVYTRYRALLSLAGFQFITGGIIVAECCLLLRKWNPVQSFHLNSRTHSTESKWDSLPTDLAIPKEKKSGWKQKLWRGILKPCHALVCKNRGSDCTGLFSPQNIICNLYLLS